MANFKEAKGSRAAIPMCPGAEGAPEAMVADVPGAGRCSCGENFWPKDGLIPKHGMSGAMLQQVRLENIRAALKKRFGLSGSQVEELMV